MKRKNSKNDAPIPFVCPECKNNNIIVTSNPHKSPTCRIIATILTAMFILILVIMAIQIVDALRIVTLVNPKTGEITYKYLFAGDSRDIPLGSFIETLPIILLIINALALIAVKIIQHILESYNDTKNICNQCGYTWTLNN